jgi:hypothetical protein
LDTIATESVDTPAGEYTIEWLPDEYAERPYNEGLGFAYDGDRDRVDVADGPYADSVLAIIREANNLGGWHRSGSREYPVSTTALARYLRITFGLSGIRIVNYDYQTFAPDSDHDRVWGIAWAPDDVPADRAGDYVDAAIAEYRAWAEGDCFGYRVLDPAGNEIDGCWGYYGYSDQRDYTRSQALDSIERDAADRGKKCALAGAGFVGII